jgi:EAL domain-containing protein (putative c-di-GMP-specific phosphodiesterase class I)/GGDEF domain-containing protein
MNFGNVIATLRRPRGLAARAVVFTCVLLLLSAMLTTATVVFGAQRESERAQLHETNELATHLANIAGNMLASGDMASMRQMADQTASRTEVRRVVIQDAAGRAIVEAGGTAADRAVVERVGGQVRTTHQLTFERTPDKGLAYGAPIIRDGQFVGVALIMWEGNAYRFDAIPSLAPFILILACLGIAAIPLTAFVVRRAVSPLDQLARFAEKIAENGEASPIDLQTGDEFETLANAFNKMTSRLDASMKQIQEIAFVDPVTRLPNQDRFVREVDHFILQERAQGEAGAVATFELQRLPKLLQTLDPEASRDFLRAVAERFTAAVRTVDRVVRLRGQGERPAVGARLGGVEFAVFAPGLSSSADAARFAQHLNAALNQPFDWRGHKLTLGACCGVALAPRDGRDADTVIRHARMAMNAASSAPARIKVFTQSLDREAVARLTLEREMRGAIERNEFRAYFQPKINLSTGRIEACEALARWIRPDRTIISPGRFIPVAEESGLIGALSDAIMREACWKAASWARAGRPAKVAVNVSALQFRNDRFAEHVLRIVHHAGLAPGQLELEITESMVMQDPDRALRIIKPLREAGVRLAIDDFGCGHSSLAALSKLPFDVIKIDQTFIRALERGDSQAAAIVEMILALAKTLNMEVVAEGIERREDMEFVAARGCHWVQGFLYGAAVSAPEFAELLRRQEGDDIEATDAA